MLHQHIFRGHDRQARRLILAKPSLVNQADTQGFTPLVVAAVRWACVCVCVPVCACVCLCVCVCEGT